MGYVLKCSAVRSLCTNFVNGENSKFLQEHLCLTVAKDE